MKAKVFQRSNLAAHKSSSNADFRVFIFPEKGLVRALRKTRVEAATHLAYVCVIFNHAKFLSAQSF